MPTESNAGRVDRLRAKLRARREGASDRAKTRKALRAEREARSAREFKQQGPPNVGGGV